MNFFQTVYGVIAAIAGGAAMFWGLFKAIGALRVWIKNKIKQIKQKNEFPKQVLKQMQEISDGISAVDGRIDQISKQLSQVKMQLEANDDATSTVMLQKMMYAYHNYVLQNNPIPLDVQTALCVMYDQYVKSGMHNHVPSDFKDRIMQCSIVGVTNLKSVS